jgi:hypothetical protein
MTTPTAREFPSIECTSTPSPLARAPSMNLKMRCMLRPCGSNITPDVPCAPSNQRRLRYLRPYCERMSLLPLQFTM